MSLQDTYQNCKNLLASNLTSQGVTASGTEGLTSLIDKVLDIVPDSLTLTSNKNILSYYDSETATLTATSSLGTTGLSVSVYNAVSGAKIGDMTDNNDGTYSYTYNSTGVGDISMTCATTTLESNSINIEDCYYYDPLTSSKSTFTIVDNTTNYSYSSNGLSTVGTSGGCYLQLDETLPTDCSIECTIKGLTAITNGVMGGLGLDNIWYEPHSSNIQFSYVNGSSTTVQQVPSIDDVIRIERIDTTYNFYVNNVAKYIKTGKPSGKYNYFFIRNVVTSGITIKDLKIKSL